MIALFSHKQALLGIIKRIDNISHFLLKEVIFTLHLCLNCPFHLIILSRQRHTQSIGGKREQRGKVARLLHAWPTVIISIVDDRYNNNYHSFGTDFATKTTPTFPLLSLLPLPKHPQKKCGEL